MIEKNQFPSLMLFRGPKGVGKGTFAEFFAKAVIGVNEKQVDHPDIRHFHPIGKSGKHSVETIRQLIQEIHLSPYQASPVAYLR